MRDRVRFSLEDGTSTKSVDPDTKRGIVFEAAVGIVECPAEATRDEWERVWARFWKCIELAGWKRTGGQ